MLVVLLVLWIVVIPVLTLAGAYVLSGVRDHRSLIQTRGQAERSHSTH